MNECSHTRTLRPLRLFARANLSLDVLSEPFFRSILRQQFTGVFLTAALLWLRLGHLLRLCSEALEGLLWCLHRRRQHEAERMKQSHARLGQRAGECAFDRTAQVSLEHHRMAHHSNL